MGRLMKSTWFRGALVFLLVSGECGFALNPQSEIRNPQSEIRNPQSAAQGKRAPSSIPKIEYSGGFDKDRYSRNFTRDETSAYIGPEGIYLLYSAKWFPINKFLVDRATADVDITAPLGFTVVGPGVQLPVTTKGITESFGWSAKQPILPTSIVAGRYFEKNVQKGGLSVDCFAREDHLEAIQKSAGVLAQILDYYTKTFGPPSSGEKCSL